MNSSLKLLLAGAILVLGMGASAQAANLDVVRDSNGTPVRTKDNACVRSNWLSDTDPCAEKAEAPKVVTESKAVYFEFGKSALTKEGKKVLDGLATDIKAKGTSVTAIRIAGYADRIGSPTANEKLSKKRADTVRKYLESKGIVNAQVVETRWFGESAPATECPKKMPKAKLIKCLQPDRRVEVEVDSVVGAPTDSVIKPYYAPAKADKPVKKHKKHHKKAEPAKAQ